MRRHTLLWSIVAGLVEISPAEAQSHEAERSAGTVVMVAVYVDACIRTDQALRDICERHRPHLPESFTARCTLPAQSFEQRTAAPYAQFREAYRAELELQATAISATQDRAERAFNQQFAGVRAGKLSGLDLDTLSREISETCVVVENEWLPRMSKGRQASQPGRDNGHPVGEARGLDRQSARKIHEVRTGTEVRTEIHEVRTGTEVRTG